MKTAAYAAKSAGARLKPYSIERRAPRSRDVLIDILYCGVCHSDIHQVRDEWGDAIFPMVPGHEIVGTVSAVGKKVTRWREGDTVGVGVMVDSCRKCEACTSGHEQYCEEGMTGTYNAYERDGKTPTYGGYSKRITVDERYVVRIPETISLDRAAPLLCAGITTYSPLRHFGVKPSDHVAVVGLGGLGHIGVKFARAMGAHVTVVSHSRKKRDDAVRLGADDFICTSKDGVLRKNTRRFDLILDTVSAEHDYDAYLRMLRMDGIMILVGLPDSGLISPFTLVGQRRSLAGSMVGGMKELQEMLDFCAKHEIASDIELVGIEQVNAAYERILKSDVRFRFVIDLATLQP